MEDITIIDWLFIAAVILGTVGIGIFYGRGSGKNYDSFFLGGRNMGWIAAGISMVATTFAVDTPLAVTEMVAGYGIAGNWQWWNFVIGGMLTAFFFAKLWYRSGVKTEAELIELRYSGKNARGLRIFKSAYLGLFINVFIMGWVNLAFVSILKVFFDVDETQSLIISFVMMLLIAIYSTYVGLKGVIISDNFQFITAMIGCIVLAFLVVRSPEIGGLSGLKEKIPAETLSFYPDFTSNGANPSLPLLSFITFLGFAWWATWYPGNEPGGGGYVAQRILSTKSQKDAGLSVFLFQVLNLCIRPWPWIIVALCAFVLYPGSGKEGYVMAMRDFMPEGIKGLMLAAFFSAYMSTISTHLNWGSGYLVNDVLPALKKNLSEKQKVGYGRLIILFFMVASCIISLFMNSIAGAWIFLMECGAGLGSVLILRWFWHRINVWSEITATFAPFLVMIIITILNHTGNVKIEFPNTFFITFSFTTVAWLIVTFLTKPEDNQTLANFFERVQPPLGWKKFRVESKDKKEFYYLVLTWFFAVIMSYSFLFTIGSIMLKPLQETIIYSIVLVLSTTGLVFFGRKSFFQ
ncbi:MAG: Na+:solute symporter [Bacteroidia bacterium]|nr:Na+:solute symporter [Bacteroidia bacterium]MCO5253572.1 Na+:solute symporter [Bacteroidota bacterium]MCZ2130658.1 Na+:solute symporter [Bacteroidia bacterium]